MQNTQTLQLFAKIVKKKVFTKVFKMRSWKALVQSQSGVTKMGYETQVL
jgi:hypothetical protein